MHLLFCLFYRCYVDEARGGIADVRLTCAVFNVPACVVFGITCVAMYAANAQPIDSAEALWPAVSGVLHSIAGGLCLVASVTMLLEARVERLKRA